MANPSFQQEARFQLSAIASRLNLHTSLFTYSNQLREGRVGEFQLPTLRAGQTYVLVGLCDRNCYDLDFSVYDENNNLVARNTAAHAYPMVRVSPKWTGDFTVHISMPSCVVNMCSYCVGVFNQQSSSR